MNEEIKVKLNEYIESLEEICKIIEKQQLQNEQMFLDFLDKLNEISVRY